MQIGYWDMSPRERAELSESDVELLTAGELMRKGVFRVRSHELEPEPPPVEGARTYYAIEVGETYNATRLDPLFPSSEAAKTAGARIVGVLAREWVDGEYVDNVKPFGGVEDARIVEVRAFDQETMKFRAEAIKRRNTIRKKNKDRTSEYETSLKVESEALAGVWTDWHDCRTMEQKLRRVVETWGEYRKLAGDDATASAFLRKAVDTETLVEVCDWYGLDGYTAVRDVAVNGDV